MKFKASINIMPQKALLDPQGKTVQANLPHAGIEGVDDVRIGKHIHLELEAANAQDAEQKVKQACEKILVNQVMEEYTYEIKS